MSDNYPKQYLTESDMTMLACAVFAPNGVPENERIIMAGGRHLITETPYGRLEYLWVTRRLLRLKSTLHWPDRELVLFNKTVPITSQTKFERYIESHKN